MLWCTKLKEIPLLGTEQKILGLEEKLLASLRVFFQVLVAKTDLGKIKQTTTKESQTNPPTEERKNLTRSPATHLPWFLLAKVTAAAGQQSMTDKGGGQTQPSQGS